MYVMKSPTRYWPPALCRIASQRIDADGDRDDDLVDRRAERGGGRLLRRREPQPVGRVAQPAALVGFSPPKILTTRCAPIASSSACVSAPVRSWTSTLTRFSRRLIFRIAKPTSGNVANAISVSCQLM